MKHSFKRFLSMVIAMAMVLSCVPVQAFAEECAHSYESVVTEPTCTEDGFTTYTCSLCGDSYTEPGVAAAGHDYQESEMVEATCADAGGVTCVCSVCGDTQLTEIPATEEHTYEDGACTVCGAEDPAWEPAEEPSEEPAEEPAEEPSEEPSEEPAEESVEEPAEMQEATPSQQLAAGSETTEEDGNEIDMAEVAQLGEDGETFTTLEKAVAAAAAIELDNRPFVSLLADCTVNETILINDAINIFYIGGDGNNPTITAAEGVDTLFEVGENGNLLINYIDMETSGDYIVNLTADNASVMTVDSNLSGAAVAAIRVAEDVNYVIEQNSWQEEQEDGTVVTMTSDSCNIQVYGGSVSGAVALEIGGTNSNVAVAGEAPSLNANSADGVIVMNGDDHNVQMHGVTMTNEYENAFTMDGDSVILGGGITFNGTDYSNPWNDPLPQSGAEARMDVSYCGTLQSALDASTELYYENGEIALTVLEELTISDTVTLAATKTPVQIRGEDITLTDTGALHLGGHVRLANTIYPGLGTVYITEGGEFEWWGGDVIGSVTWEGNFDSYISAYWVNEQGEGWFENIYQYHPNTETMRMVPGEDHCLSFYMNEWDAESGRWVRTSIGKDDMTLSDGLTACAMAEQDWVNGYFKPGAENTENYVQLYVNEDAPWDENQTITVDGVTFAVEVQRNADYGFYSAPKATNENWLINYRYNKFRPEDAFYFIFTNENFTLESVTLQDESLASISKVEDNIYKVTLNPDALQLDESINDYHNFDINVNMVVVDDDENKHYWGHNLYCEPWIRNVTDGGEMPPADLMFALDAQQNVNDWAAGWIHESVTILDKNVNNGELNIDMGIRESDGIERAFRVAKYGQIIVPDGCTLILNSPTMLNGGLLKVEAGGKLIVNNKLHVGNGTLYLEDGAYLEENTDVWDPVTWEGDEKEDHISAYFVTDYYDEQAQKSYFYETINEWGYSVQYDRQMLPGYGHALVFYLNQWNEEETIWERTPIHPDELDTDDGLFIMYLMDNFNPDEFGIRGDQKNGDCFVMLRTDDDESLWDTTRYVYYGDHSFPVYIQRDMDMGFYSAPKVSNETFLDQFGFAPGADNSFYFIITDENLTATKVTAELQAGPDVVTGGVHCVKYADNIWKLQLDDSAAEDMSRNYWLQLHIQVKDEYGNEWGEGRGLNCFPWVWNRGMPDATITFDGVEHRYYADSGKWLKNIWVDSEEGGFWSEYDAELPDGVSYDLDTNTLTLNNAHLGTLEIGYHWEGKDENGDFIEGYNLPNPDLTIELIGENRIESPNEVALALRGGVNATITGEGSLYVYNGNGISNGQPLDWNYNAADVENSTLTIGGSANVTFKVEGENYWAWDGSPATMHAIQGGETSDLIITDSATLNVQVPDLRRDESSDFGGDHRGLANFANITVEKQATVNLDTLHLYNGQSFVQNGGTVNIEDPGCLLVYEENGEQKQRPWYEPVRVNDGSRLLINGGKLDITVYMDHSNARYCGIVAENGSTVQISGGQVYVSSTVLGPAVAIGDNSNLYFTGGTLYWQDELMYPTEQSARNTFINTWGNAKATFAGGTIRMAGGQTCLQSMLAEGEPASIKWTGTTLEGYNTVLEIDGTFKMTGGLMKLEKSRIHVGNSMAITGGKLDMDDSVLIVNGVVAADGNAVLDFDVTDAYYTDTSFEGAPFPDNCVIEINNYFPVAGNAKVTIDAAFENCTDNPFAAIRNGAAYHQMGGAVTINSNADHPVMWSNGNMLLNAGALSLNGIVALEFHSNDDTENPNMLQTLDGMTLNVKGTEQAMRVFGTADIDGGSLNIVSVHSDDQGSGGHGIYVGERGTLNFNAGIHTFNTASIGIHADKGTVNFAAEPMITMNSGVTLYSVGDEEDNSVRFHFAEGSTILDTDANAEPSHWLVDENNQYVKMLSTDGTVPTTNIRINAAPATLQEVLPTLTAELVDGLERYKLARPVIVEESMSLVDANGEGIILDVMDGGKITVRNGAVLTVSESSHLIAMGGAIFVEAGSQIVNNSIMANDGGYISVQNSTDVQGYVHGDGATMNTHFNDDGLFTTIGIPEANQELHGVVTTTEGLQNILEIAKGEYPYVDIWSGNDLCLDNLYIPENTELGIDGQEATAAVTLNEGAALEIDGQLSLGNVNFTVDGELKNLGIIQTDIHDNAQITINGTYLAGDQAQMNLNRATVDVNGEFGMMTHESSLWVNDGSVVNVTKAGQLMDNGTIWVGYWKQSEEEAENNGVEYVDVAGTINVEGQLEVHLQLNVDGGSVVNVKDGGILSVSLDYDADIYGGMNITGEMNVEAGGEFQMENYLEVYGTLNVAGTLNNIGGLDLIGTLNVSGTLVNDSELWMHDTDVQQGASLILNDNGTFVNNGTLFNSSHGGIVDVTNGTFSNRGANAEIMTRYFAEDDVAVMNGIDNGMIALCYEGGNASTAAEMAEYASANGYGNSVVRVADSMTIGNGQRVVCGFMVVLQDSELTVNGTLICHSLLQLRPGVNMTIGTNGYVCSVSEMRASAGDDYFGNSVINNRGILECGSTGSSWMQIDGEYNDFGVGKLVRNLSDKGVGGIDGEAGNIYEDVQTLMTVVADEQQLHNVIDMVVNDGYRAGEIVVLSYVNITEDLYIPENVTVRIRSTGDSVGSISLSNYDAEWINDGTIIVEGSYKALDIYEGWFGGNGTVQGYCGNSEDTKALSWQLKSDILTISGYGAMADYEGSSAPWNDLYVEKIILGNGVTYIGSNAFMDCAASVVIPNNVLDFGTDCFTCNMELKVYHGSAAEEKLKDIYDLNYFHELKDGVCSCGYSLNTVLEDTLTSAKDKAEEIKNFDTESLKSEMENNEDVAGQLEQLEQEILADKNVSTETKLDVTTQFHENVSQDIADAFENVEEEASIIGAVLNAEEHVNEVKLLIGDPENASMEDEKFNSFNAEASVLFSMTMEGVGNASQLDVPVKITLPVPANIRDLSKLVVMHYHDNNKDGERVNVTLFTDENGKAFISFVVTGFSNFLVGQEATPVTLTAKVNPGTVTTAASADDIGISLTARDHNNKLVTALVTSYTITNAENEEVDLDEALTVPGEYTVTPTYLADAQYLVTVKPATLTVEEAEFVCWNTTTEQYYETVGEALAEAEAGETVQMLRDALASNKKNEGVVFVNAGTILDLNGYYLQADHLSAFGSVIDSLSGADSTVDDGGVVSGGVVISNDTAKSLVQLRPDNADYIPIYDTVTGSYKFFLELPASTELGCHGIAVDSYAISKKASDGTKVKYGFCLLFDNLEAYTILQRTDDSGLTVNLEISWTGVEKLTIKSPVSLSSIKTHAAGQSEGGYPSLIMVTLRGLASIGAGNTIRMVPAFTTQAGVFDSAAEEPSAQVYTIPQA